MSADSPRRGLHKGAQIISPQPISDRSIIDSVAGIINDIVPQAYAGAPNLENKESITWARFEYADVNNSIFYPDYIEGSATPPLLLVLGYTTGVQVWVVAASGEATEVLSWRQGVVRTLRILPDPKKDDDHADPFESKRPLVAICDSAGPGPQFCSVTFISLRTSEQTKIIKFKNPVCDVLANRRSVVVTLSEKIAVFDARTLEDVLTVTTCYPSPGPNPNPVALGTRWLAYSEKKLLPARRSSGGSEGEGVQSYTATVLYAAKSLGKGLRGLGETVASSLTGNSVMPMAMNNIGGDVTQPGVVTILDLQAAKEEKELDDPTIETVVAHFTAHNDAIVAITFDLTGALLMTADKRGHDFHVFRIQPHPGGPTLAAVHHLYVLHRGDTTAKVQDMTFSSDTRWAAVSTVRGTTHVFPVAPYGGPVGVRTHSTPHVVNRLSRFHRSAGLTDDGTRSHSPVSHAELPISVYPYSNPRLPPYPHPTILHPLAQIRQPSTLNHANNQTQPSRPQQRQRLHSEDSGTLPLKICACFAPPRAWIYAQRDSTTKVAKRAVDSLFIMACHGNMIQYDLEPKPAAGVPKEKVCDDTTIELEVEAKGQWPLLRTPNSLEIVPPLPSSSPLLCSLGSPKGSRHSDMADDRWLSQVEIVTHAGPHRRLWMGPQFVFKTYNAPSGVNLIESEAIEIGVTGGSRPARSNPVNMPHAATRPLVPVVIDGSGSSYEQSPRFVEAYGDSLDNDTMGIGNGENQLREDLAEAMLETSATPHRAAGRRLVVERVGQPVTKVVNPLGTVITVLADEEDVTSSQDYDDATPEPPRSVCAEEGPASLNDFDNEGQDLKNLTEICAEMRSTDEPAIDNVPDESIKDVEERKTLCVEVASTTINPNKNSIDFESDESFRDVPTSLSLCAERGEIPNSPMTRARENTWNERETKLEDDELQEKTFAKAKYVVSYDDESVVLMENKTMGKKLRPIDVRKEIVTTIVKDSSKMEGTSKKSDVETERSFKRPSKLTSNARANKRSSTCGNREQPKYVVHEHEDSIVIEDTTMTSRNVATKKSETERNNEVRSIDVGENEETMAKKNSSGETTSTGTREKRVRGKDRRDSNNFATPTSSIDVNNVEIEAMVIESRESNEKIETIESFVDVKDVETIVADESTSIATNVHEPMEATTATGSASLPLEALAVDEISSMDYHIVEANNFTVKDNHLPSHQSDDDIEHIHSSEVTQMLETIDKIERSDDCEISPVRQRKNSKSTISDDDLEHINSSELTEINEEPSTIVTNSAKSLAIDKNDIDDFQKITNPENPVTTFDEDIEHVYHSEINDHEPPSTSSTTSVIAPKLEPRKKSLDNSTNDRTTSLRSRGSRKRKDVVVIDSDTSEADITVIVKSLEVWNKSKTPEKDLAEEIDRSAEPKDHFNDQTTSLSLPKKTRVRTGKIVSTTSTNVQKRHSQTDSDMIEIIDIDAMQKAEMEVANDCNVTPECKIFEPRHDPPRSQKSRKNKKVHLETSINVETIAPMVSQSAITSKRVNDRAKDVEAGEPEIQSAIGWSSIVSKPDAVEKPEIADQGEKLSIKRPVEVEIDVKPPYKVTTSTENNEITVVTDAKPSKSSQNDFKPSSKSQSTNSDVQERISGTKKRGKKTRTSGFDVDQATSSPIKNIPVEIGSIVDNTLIDESELGETSSIVKNHASTNVVEKIAKSEPEIEIADVKMIEEPKIDLNTDLKLAATAVTLETNVVPTENPLIPSPKQPTSQTETEIELESTEKRNDSDHENAPERSSSSDDFNANVVPMDTEEDVAARENAEKNGSTGVSPSWSAVNKKNTRSKKKKRR